MKKNILIGIVICILLSTNSIFTYAEDDSLEQFGDVINNAWIQRDNLEILRLIQDGLNSYPNDVLALGVKMGYYGAVNYDALKARKAADKFYETVEQYGNTDMTQWAEWLRKEIYSTPINLQLTQEKNRSNP